MKKILTLISLAAATLAGANGSIFVTEVMSSSSHAGGAGNGDWFELYNSGESAVDLSLWSWDDDTQTPGSHSFGTASIAPGGFVLVVDENATTIINWANDVWGVTPSLSLVVLNNTQTTSFSGFGATGDKVFVYDSASVQQASVTFGATTTGHSFAWSKSGDYLGVSASGTDGAYTALLDGNDGGSDTNPLLYGPGTDVASPGSAAVPEPTTWALCGIAAALVFLRKLGPCYRFVRSKGLPSLSGVAPRAL
jgi:hypothetical protein